MNSSKSWVDRLWNDPPVIFPVAAVFHLFLLVRALVDFSGSMAENAFTLLWYAVAFVLSVFIIFMQRWAAVAYILLTFTGLLLLYVLHVSPYWKGIGSTLTPFDAIYGFFLIFFFKRFR